MTTIGIDLGTTHSLVATVLSGTPRCLLDDDERAILPSVVGVNGNAEPISVGYGALQSTAENGQTFSSVKRFMGRAPADAAADAQELKYVLADDPRVLRFAVGEGSITPIEISAVILNALQLRAEECLFSTPTGAVITVPAYFDDAQRQATKDAARLAGLNVLRLLNEPTAAAIAYGLAEGASGQKVVVYDLGGGTFDISILELHEGVFQVLSTAGDTRLGGDDFDHALAHWVLEQQQMALENLDAQDIQIFLRAVERAKRELSDTLQSTVRVSLSDAEIEQPIRREQFEQLIAPLISRTGEAINRAMADAKLDADDIAEVVLVGGSTRVPAVRAFVAKELNCQPHTELNPDLVVALGAAVQADILGGASELADDLQLLDVLPLSLGVEIMGGIVERLIPRCTPIPASASQTFTTSSDGQTGLSLHVLQGERERVQDNRSLAQFSLKGLPDLPAGIPRIKVQFNVDADGLLNVEAREEFTGAQASISIRPSHGLTEDEIEQMLEEAIDNAESDVDERLLVEATQEALQVLAALEKSLAQDREMASATELAEMESAASRLRAALEEADRKAISSLTHKLDEVSAPFAQRRIERDLALALSGKTTEAVSEKLGL